MAKLKKGSTVGGFAIITEDNNNHHVHQLSDIDGLGSAAGSETGPGSGFNADSLNGNHYSDIESSFVNRSGDDISSKVRITGQIPTDDLGAISKKHVIDYIDSELISSSDVIPFVSISSSVSLTYTTSNNTAKLSSGDILIGGRYFSFTDMVVTITPSNSEVQYIYVVLNSNTLSLEVNTSHIVHDFTKILVGTVNFTTGGNFIDVSQRSSMTNLGGYSVSSSPLNNSMLLSGNTGELDEQWFDIDFSDSIDTVCLKGNTTVVSDSENEYQITDYDAFSNYSATSNLGACYIVDDVVKFVAPTTTDLKNVTMNVTRNSNTVEFNIKVIP